MDDLPDDIIYEICKNLNFPDLERFVRTNKRAYSVCSSMVSSRKIAYIQNTLIPQSEFAKLTPEFINQYLIMKGIVDYPITKTAGIILYSRVYPIMDRHNHFIAEIAQLFNQPRILELQNQWVYYDPVTAGGQYYNDISRYIPNFRTKENEIITLLKKYKMIP